MTITNGKFQNVENALGREFLYFLNADTSNAMGCMTKVKQFLESSQFISEKIDERTYKFYRLTFTCIVNDNF